MRIKIEIASAQIVSAPQTGIDREEDAERNCRMQQFSCSL